MPDLSAMPPVSPSDTYRPLNFVAVIGMVFGVLSLLIFIYNAPWMFLMLPLPGILLSLIAYRQIRGSDGTQAGEKFATTGLVLSIVAGLSSVTMYVTANLIVRAESTAFLDAWIEKCLKGKDGEAFLDCVDPDQRIIAFSPDDVAALRRHFPDKQGSGSAYDRFRQESFPAQLLRYQDRTEVTEPGIIDVFFDKDVWTVRHHRNVATPEYSCGMIIALKSQVIPGRRGWKIELAATRAATATMRLTPYGAELRDAVKDAGRGLDRSLHAIAEGHRADAFAFLKKPVSPALEESFGSFYKLLRREASSETQRVDLTMNQPLLLRDRKEGKGWVLETSGGVEVAQREVEYRFTLETDDIRAGPMAWRLSNCVVQGERRKVGPAVLSASPGGGLPGKDEKREPK